MPGPEPNARDQKTARAVLQLLRRWGGPGPVWDRFIGPNVRQIDHLTLMEMTERAGLNTPETGGFWFGLALSVDQNSDARYSRNEWMHLERRLQQYL